MAWRAKSIHQLLNPRGSGFARKFIKRQINRIRFCRLRLRRHNAIAPETWANPAALSAKPQAAQDNTVLTLNSGRY
jgi:hypothetical protein